MKQILLAIASITIHAKASSTPSSGSSRSLLGDHEHIFCPESAGDNINYVGTDFGVNIYSRTSAGSQYAEDCYLRYSKNHLPSAATILNGFIDPAVNTIVISHGWQPGTVETHETSDRWDRIVGGTCVSGSNSQDLCEHEPCDPCEPADHTAQAWISRGWNVIYLDWRQFANEHEVKDAEKKQYTEVYNGKNVKYQFLR